MPNFERRLPHWTPDSKAIFVTWRLHGSLPVPKPEWEVLPAGKRFAAEDKALLHSTGPRHLSNPKIADCVARTLIYAADHLSLYDLQAWVIMSNHVHILIEPHAPVSQVMRSIKSYSAKQANLVLGHTGERFWQIESFDHWVRTEKEFDKIVRYIEFNPVSAALVTQPEDWPWSSAWKGAGREACATK